MCPQVHGTLPGIRNSVLLRPDPTPFPYPQTAQPGKGDGTHQLPDTCVSCVPGHRLVWLRAATVPLLPLRAKNWVFMDPRCGLWPWKQGVPTQPEGAEAASSCSAALLCARKPEGTRAGRFPRKPSSLPACSVLELSPSAVP